MKNYFFKPEFENLSQGAGLKFVRELRYMSKPTERLEDLAELFDVSNYAIRRYNFVDPNEVRYYHM